MTRVSLNHVGLIKLSSAYPVIIVIKTSVIKLGTCINISSDSVRVMSTEVETRMTLTNIYTCPWGRRRSNDGSMDDEIGK